MILKGRSHQNHWLLRKFSQTKNLSVTPPSVLKKKQSQPILTEDQILKLQVFKRPLNILEWSFTQSINEEEENFTYKTTLVWGKENHITEFYPFIWQMTRRRYYLSLARILHRQQHLEKKLHFFQESTSYWQDFFFSTSWWREILIQHFKNFDLPKKYTSKNQKKLNQFWDDILDLINWNKKKATLPQFWQRRFQKKFESWVLLKSFKKVDRKRTQMSNLRDRIDNFHIRVPRIFHQPWENISLPLTRRERWLNKTYDKYQELFWQDRIDFFRTYLGQIIASSYWRKRVSINYSFNTRDEKFYSWRAHIPLAQTYEAYHWIHKTGWWYDNLIQSSQIPRSVKKFVLYRPKTAFQIHWKQQQVQPWKDPLLFRRALYSGFIEEYRNENKFETLKLKPYLRSKNPRSEKKNRLYKRIHFFFYHFGKKNRIRRSKFARIQQLIYKMVNPFYGHLRIRQSHRLVKKTKKIKSQIWSRHEILLSRLENRLDVVVCRLNLAPSILWARRLIKAGLIFVTSQRSRWLWESMYGGLKKLSFPLKLRDPKNLYAKTYWTERQQNWVEFKFLGQPQKKISYLLQAGDLIQCALATHLNQFKTLPRHFQKPIPSHLMVLEKKKHAWIWPTQTWEHNTFNPWEQNSPFIYTGLFLHTPRLEDLDSRDRVNEFFVRWAML